jgi:hypothetical protein
MFKHLDLKHEIRTDGTEVLIIRNGSLSDVGNLCRYLNNDPFLSDGLHYAPYGAVKHGLAIGIYDKVAVL